MSNATRTEEKVQCLAVGDLGQGGGLHEVKGVRAQRGNFGGKFELNARVESLAALNANRCVVLSAPAGSER